MECPCCGKELSHHDSYYTGNYAAYLNGHSDSGYQELGDIFKCENEHCECFEGFYYTRGENDSALYEGYPC